MIDLLWLIPTLPLFGSLALILTGGRLSNPAVAWIGVGSVGLAALIAAGIAYSFLTAPPMGHVFTQTLWRWFEVGGFTPELTLYLDALSLVMMLVITGVGFLIHLYSSAFMEDDDGYSRFFAYMNLFVAAMLVLVLADNLLFLLLGWEGVGLCSYLLIGFWYRDPANGAAARKAFIVTRAGDAAMLVGLFLLFTQLGTLEIQNLMLRAAQDWPTGSGIAVAATLLLLAGAIGKSAQLPLQTWLPDAMAGPTPVSALIHAATMVTAGMYLIARMHGLFELAPVVQALVAIIGALTLLLAGFSALAQTDIKRVLAYSTISQIGYMFLALGVGAWSAAVFHFMTHAFFKALLFLAAGVVILSLHHEHDIFKMGGLWKRLPVTFVTFLIGAASLASLPLITAGFYSKDLILWQTLALDGGSVFLWLAGWIGAFVTALYSFRLIFIVFFGEAKTPVEPALGWRLGLPLIVLAVLSILGGFIETPPTLGGVSWFSDLLHTALPATGVHAPLWAEIVFQLLAAVAALGGIYLAWRWFLRRPHEFDALMQKSMPSAAWQLWRRGWDFDRFYNRVFVRPFLWFARTNRNDLADAGVSVIAWVNIAAHRLLSRTQTGELRWYAAGIAGGSAVVIAVTIFF